ncbi:hypothetical protein A2641_03425 [Candidatus Nomurabacteria bacterium RIFCSPHIGHO2_01_FULL_37_25]|uniref:DUF4190 domain-containing protein n=1 Tax=Candidatus Nomurabacteria bacterium RIFCSPLOWO2_01_FULL_36_16 TaxID=1801767 RepID=A0A1F6WZT2_9BACT|nr:MAG: hypothetical protein A2641_03425 [Candidatus Nomurabacteria bacterium RIFCSPHIGHO2_01_FULL_37_25]OGI75540.1 MAG: hypothetical protein A3D36_03070 [Candidatus Nomurabacteria bacterium RIFCSPHIGHO2_02_FULL_36_29]OGI87378.1 MAG: hypothetical protein A3A91_02690 [Candidatus Nomurabacteria bacterium RIFCSPLOWO2_01_FULL_36_16]
MKKKLIVLSGFVLGLAPVMALAQVTTGGTSTNCASVGTGTIEAILCKIAQLFTQIVPIIIILGVIYFVWGVISYVIGDDAEAKKKGRDRIIFGIIGLAVIVTVWGLVKILTNTFGIDTNPQTITFPTTPF